MAYTADQIIEWSRQFFPALKFSQGPNGAAEPFYPIDADAWITHQADPSVSPPPGTDPFQRGSSLYRWRAASITETAEQWTAQLPRIGPGQVTLDASATGIGAAEFAARPPADPATPGGPASQGDWYLDFGGWSEPATRAFGQLGYGFRQWTQRVHGPLGLPAAVAPDEPAPAPSSASDAPTRFTPDRSALHAYAEFAPIRDVLNELLAVPMPADLADLDQAKARLQGAADQLGDYLGLTYYLLYPAHVPPDQKVMEGDWEALSMFLVDQGGGAVDLRFASYSQGYACGIYPVPMAACKSAADLERSGAHPVAYVAFGSHANYFTPLSSEQTVTPGVNWGQVAGYGAAGVVATIGAICIGAGLAASPIGWVAVIVGVVLLVVAALIALFTWLFTKDDEAPAPPPYDNAPRNDAHAGDGAPAGGSAAGTPSNPPPAPGSPAAQGQVPFLVHPVSADRTVVDARTDPPPWWGYVGRWGVCVDDATAMRVGASFGNGTWRRMPDGYTLTHRNVEALLDYLTGEIDRKTKTSQTYRNDG